MNEVKIKIFATTDRNERSKQVTLVKNVYNALVRRGRREFNLQWRREFFKCLFRVVVFLFKYWNWRMFDLILNK